MHFLHWFPDLWVDKLSRDRTRAWRSGIGIFFMVLVIVCTKCLCTLFGFFAKKAFVYSIFLLNAQGFQLRKSPFRENVRSGFITEKTGGGRGVQRVGRLTHRVNTDVNRMLP